MHETFPNAPLFFVVAQVQYNPLYSFETFVPALQERFRKAGYPDVEKRLLVEFNLTTPASADSAQVSQPASLPGQQRVSFRFLNSARTSGFLLDDHSLSFLTTAYDTFEKFEAEFLRGVEWIANEFGGLAYVDRVGVRYLNAVVPRTAESIVEYLETSFLGLPRTVLASIPSAKFEVTYGETRFIDSANHKVTARVFIYNRDLTWPLDMSGTGTVLAVPEKFRMINGEHAGLDTDAATMQRMEFDVSTLGAELKTLHDLAENVFHATVTDHARAAFREEAQ